MAFLFVHAQNGNDANPGTAASPKQTYSAVETFLIANPSGSDVRLAGTFLSENWDLPALTNVSIDQWEGQAQHLARADAELTLAWVNSVGAEWEYTFAVATEPDQIGRVFENWETRKDSQGANLGAMSTLGIISGAGSLVANEFVYDKPTRLLTVRMHDDDNPNNFTMTFVASGSDKVDAPTFSGLCTNVSIANLRHWLYAAIDDNSEAAVVGMGLRFSGGAAGLTIDNCEFRDNGDAHIGFNGAVNFDDITISKGSFYGGSFQGGAVNVVMDGVNMSNLTISDFTILGYPTLDRNSVRPTDVPVGINKEHRCFWLAADAANTLLNIEIHDGFVDCYNISSFLRVENWNAGAGVSDLEDFSTFPIRVHNVRVENARTIMQPVVLGGALAFRRCYLDASFMQDVDVTFTFAMSGILGNAGYIFLESCVLIGDTTGSTGSLVQLSGSARCFAVNTTFYNRGTTVDPAVHGIFKWASSGIENLKCIQCVLAMSTENALCFVNSNPTVQAVNLNMVDCWYFGYDPANMTDEASLNTVDEWISSLDANGVYGTDPEFHNAPTNLEGTGGGALREDTRIVAGSADVGIRGLLSSDHWGPYQYGGAPQLPLMGVG